jgi:hypothetical protein
MAADGVHVESRIDRGVYYRTLVDAEGLEGGRPKSAYTQIVDAVIPVATFAGGITLATQLIIQCPDSRLQALLATSSQLFLNVPLVLITIHIVLYGKKDEDPVGEFMEYRPFIIAQFAVAGVETAIAFVLLSVAIYVADTSHNTVGIWGICLTGISVITGILTTLYPLLVRSRVFWSLLAIHGDKPPDDERYDRSYHGHRRDARRTFDEGSDGSDDNLRHDRTRHRRRSNAKRGADELQEQHGSSRDNHSRDRNRNHYVSVRVVDAELEGAVSPGNRRVRPPRHSSGNRVHYGMETAPRGSSLERHGSHAATPKIDRRKLQLKARRVAVLLGALLFQLAFAGILVGFGAHAASTAPVQFGCSSSPP